MKNKKCKASQPPRPSPPLGWPPQDLLFPPVKKKEIIEKVWKAQGRISRKGWGNVNSQVDVASLNWGRTNKWFLSELQRDSERSLLSYLYVRRASSSCKHSQNSEYAKLTLAVNHQGVKRLILHASLQGGFVILESSAWIADFTWKWTS